MSFKKTLIIILIIITSVFIFKNTPQKKSALNNQDILITFDNKRIWGTSPENGFDLKLSNEHKTQGHYSLEVLYPTGEYPSINTHQFNHSWGTYNYLTFDIYNPQNETIDFAIRLDDNKNSRFNISYPLNSGLNHIKIARSQIASQINADNIDYIVLFINKPQKRYKLFFDHMRLER